MESIKRFLLEERASSEAVSSVILIAMAATLLTVGLLVYWGAFNRIFAGIGTWLDDAPLPTTWTPS